MTISASRKLRIAALEREFNERLDKENAARDEHDANYRDIVIVLAKLDIDPYRLRDYLAGLD